MSSTSKTGLTASPIKKLKKPQKMATVQLCAIASRAPFILKPYASLYNPYPYGCSLLCNHPTDVEAKELLKKAKDNKNILLPEEITTIREALLDRIKSNNENQMDLLTPMNKLSAIDSVPEELFRRYTETDSRPLTPAPTLASGATRASGSRRCVTPDPQPTNKIREKTLLVLDLRRSHSQETLSYYGSSSLLEPPLIRIHHIGDNGEEVTIDEKIKPNASNLSAPSKVSSKEEPATSSTATATKTEEPEGAELNEEETDDEEFIKRRGKRRKKKGRDASRGPPAFQASLDPETQVATLGTESHNPSARPSLVPDLQLGPGEKEVLLSFKQPKILKPSASLDVDSFLDAEILRQLRRELNEEIVDIELDGNRRKALEEALKTIVRNNKNCSDEMKQLKKQLKLANLNSELWISLPRTFTRSSARFELPMDSRQLNTMTPLDYIKEHVTLSKSRKLLYNCIFNRFKIETDSESDLNRLISGKTLQDALDLMMGKKMTEKQSAFFRNLIDWKEDDLINFKLFCGICAVCERILAPEFCAQLPDRKMDPCHEIETADFEVLARKLHGQNVDERLIIVLNAIKTL